MRYLDHKIDRFLVEWKTALQHKPLIVKGPWQVGKTESVRHFAERSYENVIYINFVEDPKYKLITTDGYKTDDIVKNISCLDPGKQFLPSQQDAKREDSTLEEDFFVRTASELIPVEVKATNGRAKSLPD